MIWPIKVRLVFKVISALIVGIFLWNQIAWAGDLYGPIDKFNEEQTAEFAPSYLQDQQGIQEDLISNKQNIEDFLGAQETRNPEEISLDLQYPKGGGDEFSLSAFATREGTGDDETTAPLSQQEQIFSITTEDGDIITYNGNDVVSIEKADGTLICAIEGLEFIDNEGNLLNADITYPDETMQEVRDGNIAKITKPDGTRILVENKKLKEIVDTNGIKTTYQYAPDGLTCDVTIDDHGNINQYRYIKDSAAGKFTIEDGSSTYEYDALWNLEKFTDEIGIIEHSYDISGIYSGSIFMLQDGTIKEYDVNRNLIETILPDGTVYEYNQSGTFTGLLQKAILPDETAVIYDYNITPEGNLAVYKRFLYNNNNLQQNHYGTGYIDYTTNPTLKASFTMDSKKAYSSAYVAATYYGYNDKSVNLSLYLYGTKPYVYYSCYDYETKQRTYDYKYLDITIDKGIEYTAEYVWTDTGVDIYLYKASEPRPDTPGHTLADNQWNPKFFMSGSNANVILDPSSSGTYRKSKTISADRNNPLKGSPAHTTEFSFDSSASYKALSYRIYSDTPNRRDSIAFSYYNDTPTLTVRRTVSYPYEDATETIPLDITFNDDITYLIETKVENNTLNLYIYAEGTEPADPVYTMENILPELRVSCSVNGGEVSVEAYDNLDRYEYNDESGALLTCERALSNENIIYAYDETENLISKTIALANGIKRIYEYDESGNVVSLRREFPENTTLIDYESGTFTGLLQKAILPDETAVIYDYNITPEGNLAVYKRFLYNNNNLQQNHYGTGYIDHTTNPTLKASFTMDSKKTYSSAYVAATYYNYNDKSVNLSLYLYGTKPYVYYSCYDYETRQRTYDYKYLDITIDKGIEYTAEYVWTDTGVDIYLYKASEPRPDTPGHTLADNQWNPKFFISGSNANVILDTSSSGTYRKSKTIAADRNNPLKGSPAHTTEFSFDSSASYKALSYRIYSDTPNRRDSIAFSYYNNTPTLTVRRTVSYPYEDTTETIPVDITFNDDTTYLIETKVENNTLNLYIYEEGAEPGSPVYTMENILPELRVSCSVNGGEVSVEAYDNLDRYEYNDESGFMFDPKDVAENMQSKNIIIDDPYKTLPDYCFNSPAPLVFPDGVTDIINNETYDFNLSIVLPEIERLPEISSVSSSALSKTGDKYAAGSMVKIEVEERYNAKDITSATIRITSASLNYDSGFQNLTVGDAIFYHWDTTGLNTGADYLVEVELTDERGDTDQDDSLIITLVPNFSAPKILTSQTDLIVPATGISADITRTYLLDSGFDGALGFGWSHTYLTHIIETADGLVKIFNSDGSGSFFTSKGDGTYESPKGDFRALTKDPDEIFTLKEKTSEVTYFDSGGKLTAMEDRNGNRLDFYYTEEDSPLESIVDSCNQVTQFTYDENKHLISITDPAERTISYNYDDDGNLISATDFAGLQTSYTYDENHNLISIAYPSGKQTFFTIDDNDRLTNCVNQGGNNSLSYEYDETSARMTVTDGLGNQTVYTHNQGLVTSITDPAGNVSEMVYDDDLNLVSNTDTNDNQTTYTYDTAGNLLTETDIMNQVTTFTYEPVFNQVASITDPAGNTTNFEYDANGNLIIISYPNNSQEQFSYDSQGNMTGKTDRMNQTINFEYDSRGRLIEKSFPDSNRHIFTYNEASDLLSATDDCGTTYLTYDEFSRLTTMAYPGGEIIGYDYDTGGNFSQLTYPDGTIVDYGYDEVNRLSQINYSGQTLVSYTYDSMSRVVRRDLQNGVYTQFTYDENNSLLSLSNKKSSGEVISYFDYTYDNVGNRLTMTTLEGTTQYAYDELYQLIGVISPATAATSYNYDEAGNRTSVTEDGATTDYTSNDLNQYTEIDGTTYSYDANGNLINDGSRTYTYDYENRLTGLEYEGNAIEHTYDSFGRRISKTTSSDTIRYIYNGSQVIMEKDESGTIQAKYIYGIGIDEILLMIRDGRNYYYCQDGLGSVVQIIDNSGEVIEQYKYDAYGNTTIKDGSGIPLLTSVIGNPYGFTGRRLEQESDLYYYRARYYDPALGRFLTPDPIGFAGGDNFYTYVANNPINFTDPMGLYNPMDHYCPGPSGFIFANRNEHPNVGKMQNAGVIFGYVSWQEQAYVPPSAWDQCNPHTATRAGLESFINRNYGPSGDITRQFERPWGADTSEKSGGFSGWLRSFFSGDPTFVQPPEKHTLVIKTAQKRKGLVAKISLPYENSLVRANVPVFGLAHGSDFKEYWVEYGEGREPSEWVVIEKSTTPKSEDVSLQCIDVSKDQTIYGNLATWNTGLKNYTYGDEYTADHTIDLNGVYTLRLVVSNNRGETIEDRIIVEVGRVIPNIYGGTALSSDKKVTLTVPEQAIKDSFRVIAVKPVENESVALSTGQKLVGEIYEFRPAGEQFTKPVNLEIGLPNNYSNELDFEKLGIYAYNSGSKKWEHFPATVDNLNGRLITALSGLPEELAHFAILENSSPADEIIVSRFWVDTSGQSENAFVNIENLSQDYLIFHSFEGGTSGWANRDGELGAALTLVKSNRLRGGHCLQVRNKNRGGNFATTITDVAFDAQEYPWVKFDYKISPKVKMNFLVKMDERWYDIEFTDNPKRYHRLNMEKIGKIRNVRADGRWRTAGFDLYRMLKNHPPLQGKKDFIIQEMIMADWDSRGYMKLVHGNNRKGAAYYIDNFSIGRMGKNNFYAEDYRKEVHTVSLVTTTVSPTLAESTVGKKVLPIEDFQNQNNSTGLEQGGLFSDDGFKGKVYSSIEPDGKDNPCLKIGFDVSKQDDYAGYYRSLEGVDLHGYKTLCFRVKAERGNEVMRIGLKNKQGQESKVLVNTYVKKGIGTKWQTVSIPLKAFPELRDFSSLENISFIVENSLGNSAGAIFIDDICFKEMPAPLRVANYSNLKGKNGWGNDSWTFKTSKAEINAHYDWFGCLINYSGIISRRDQESWAGWGMDLGGLDASSYGTLAFKIKKIHGTEKPNLYLDDGMKKQYVDLEQYMGHSTDWQIVEIPLKDFTKQGIDVSHLQGLSLVFEWEQMEGALYIDDIAFVHAKQRKSISL